MELYTFYYILYYYVLYYILLWIYPISHTFETPIKKNALNKKKVLTT